MVLRRAFKSTAELLKSHYQKLNRLGRIRSLLQPQFSSILKELKKVFRLSEERSFKTKIAGQAAIFVEITGELCRFHTCPNAFGAQQFFHTPPVFHHGYPLQIG